MSDEMDERERLRLDIETFLRIRYQLTENWQAERELWDGRQVAAMGFRAPWGEVYRTAPLSDFEAWRLDRQEPLS